MVHPRMTIVSSEWHIHASGTNGISMNRHGRSHAQGRPSCKLVHISHTHTQQCTYRCTLAWRSLALIASILLRMSATSFARCCGVNFFMSSANAAQRSQSCACCDLCSALVLHSHCLYWVGCPSLATCVKCALLYSVAFARLGFSNVVNRNEP
jgi:hypothetical protein